jgi:hypothetical protein
LSIIPALWRLRQEVLKFEASSGYPVRPCIPPKNTRCTKSLYESIKYNWK